MLKKLHLIIRLQLINRNTTSSTMFGLGQIVLELHIKTRIGDLPNEKILNSFKIYYKLFFCILELGSILEFEVATVNT